jgi:transcriptional regulator with XRE-family HTH domain
MNGRSDRALSDQMRAARLAAGLSISEVARRAKTSRAAITTYEAGTVSPSLDTAQRVLAATGHTLRVVPSRGRKVAERLRGRGDVAMTTDEIMAHTRGD